MSRALCTCPACEAASRAVVRASALETMRELISCKQEAGLVEAVDAATGFLSGALVFLSHELGPERVERILRDATERTRRTPVPEVHAASLN